MKNKILIEFKPYSKMRYKTCGDWYTDKNGLDHIDVADLGDKLMNLAIAIHELLEAADCERLGITQQAVDKFDFKHQNDEEEPGENPKAPYHRPHMRSDVIERAIIQLYGLDWNNYEKRINKVRK